MDDLLGIIRCVSELQEEMNAMSTRHFEELAQSLYGVSTTKETKSAEIVPPKQTSSSITPQQTKKRAKRLSSLVEVEGDVPSDASVASSESSQRQSARISNSKLLADALEEEEENEVNTTGILMPPPAVPAVGAPFVNDTSISSGRPQRAARLRSEKNLKEQPLKAKLRRPSENEMVKVKVESEQRASQLHNISSARITQGKTTLAQPEAKVATAEVAAAAALIPDPAPEPVDANEADEKKQSTTNLRIMIKREKVSIDSTATTTVTLEATRSAADDTTQLSTTTASNTTAAPAKKGRKKKETHKPIKVERFSDLDKSSPISSRTRGTRNSQEPQPAPRSSVYEDAVEGLPNAVPIIANETVTIMPNATNGAPMSEVTFNVPTSNATMTLGNATFQVEAGASEEKDQSMQTAREGSFPEMARSNSIMTEDESLHSVTKAPVMPPPTPLKGHKMPVRTHELFNPLMQSPVKLRVEAFENAANAHSSTRPKRVVGNSGSSTTPVIGKLPVPTLGRFHTPTQSSNAAPVNSAQPKKPPMSANKATSLMKTATGTNLKSTNSTSSKTLSREHSGEDFRKGLHQLAEERKKQREQKHLQAAQLREAKERERAERIAKLNKEREEKRIKKQLEKEKLEERKRLEMEELQRKLCQQEEAERLKKTKAKEQERELLQQMKAKQMMPPPPKSKYTFEMLHEDDSTDDEGKVSYKRPPPPSWSRSHVRGAAIIMQSFCPTDVIDSFFSVAPTTPDLKQIFPNIDPSYLKRNSSVLWSTPPRYSELPKY
ncbi:inner centromere protein [Drosophila grimshawi]|uniref:GH21527 n=1 Tax=Drosophila grimshawi TaxID=7222 RepID=B4J4B5_DROGR|nr:inner centromere protein [Drosophila grimshawi]EDW01597.1 GH21527 [Drosophila grimshawi]